jgi:hypothetical protein
VLRQRWNRLVGAPASDRAELLKETPDRLTSTVAVRVSGFAHHSGTIGQEKGPCPSPERIAYRAFDRHHLIPDARLIDRVRPALWQVRSDRQVYVSEQHDEPLTGGPGLLFSSDVPDIHYYKGRGGRVLPLYRDAAGIAPNVAPGLLKAMSRRLGVNASAEDLLAYVAGVTAHSGYTARFADELKSPGVRVPLTADPRLWSAAAGIGRQVLWLHTYGERFTDPTQGRPLGAPKLPQDRRPKVLVTIPDTADLMPEAVTYDEATRTLHVGSGQIRPVSPQAWAYETSGMKVIRKWFGYRKKDPAGRRSSPLDDINAGHWTARYTTDLLDLLNVLEMCVDLEPLQADALARIVDGPLITSADLKQEGVFPVSANARKPLPPESPDAPTLL